MGALLMWEHFVTTIPLDVLQQTLNSLGKFGWELIQYSSSGQAIFKRPRRA